MMLWNEHPLVLRDILINEQAARNDIIDMLGGLAAIAKTKRRLTTQPPIMVSSDRVSFLATVSRQLQPRMVEESREGQGLEGFRAPEFVDQHFIDEDTRAVFAKMPLEDTLPRFQMMLLRSATYVRDVEVEILSLRSEFLSKDKMIAVANTQIQKLSTSITDLQGRLNKAAVDGEFDVEKSILDQIKLKAPDLDVSEVDAFKKVVDGKYLLPSFLRDLALFVPVTKD
ncbi:hypothetical protein AHAS_Ahas14G0146700 [Arachis hypogaea]